MNTRMRLFVLGTILALSPSAWAHTDEYFESVEAPHGGQLRMVGPYHFEIVAKDGEITLYVTDHADNKISIGTGQGKATVETGTARVQVGLHPVGDNVLKGAGVFSLKPETVVIVFFKLPDREAHSARFMPLKPKGGPGEKPQEGTSAPDGGEHHHHHHPPKP